MAEITLVAETGRPRGSAASRRLRHAGRVPAVVYGHGMEPLAVSVGARDLRTALLHGSNQVLTLEVGKDRHMVLARQLQRHPVRHAVSHVDFQVVRSGEVVSAEVPIVLVGTASQVEMARGVVEHVLSTLTVRTTPSQIPSEIKADVSALEVGGAIRVRDLLLPEGVTADVDPDEAVVIATVTRAAEAATAVGTEGEGGEAAEPADAEEA
jgi:large subunit ribosomal protein L25